MYVWDTYRFGFCDLDSTFMVNTSKEEKKNHVL